MKKILAAVVIAASLSACHYGQDEAKETLERNEQYKNEKADFSVNRAGEYGSQGEARKSADTTAVAAPADSTAHAAPADHHAH